MYSKEVASAMKDFFIAVCETTKAAKTVRLTALPVRLPRIAQAYLVTRRDI